MGTASASLPTTSIIMTTFTALWLTQHSVASTTGQSGWRRAAVRPQPPAHQRLNSLTAATLKAPTYFGRAQSISIFRYMAGMRVSRSAGARWTSRSHAAAGSTMTTTVATKFIGMSRAATYTSVQIVVFSLQALFGGFRHVHHHRRRSPLLSHTHSLCAATWTSSLGMSSRASALCSSALPTSSPVLRAPSACNLALVVRWLGRPGSSRMLGGDSQREKIRISSQAKIWADAYLTHTQRCCSHPGRLLPTCWATQVDRCRLHQKLGVLDASSGSAFQTNC